MIRAISPIHGYLLLAIFGVVMILLTALKSRGHYWKTQVGFLAAGRKVSWFVGSLSIAVSWIWAPALFISVQQAYQQGIPGIFWFTFPNIICLLILAPLGLRIRKYLPDGYTQPEWIQYRFNKTIHKLYLFPFFWYQVMAVVVQLYAGGNFVSLLTGIPLIHVMVILAGVVLIYSVISGMRASIMTDYLQYALIFFGGLIILPWTIHAAGGWHAIKPGLGGVTGLHKNLLDPQVAFSFGIVTSIGLISGILGDQQHWQRAFVIKKEQLAKAYIWGGIFFGIVPIGLSLLGFIGANQALHVTLPQGVDPAMIGVAVIVRYLPAWAVLFFVIMLLSSLCATLDSGLCAAGSLYAVDVAGYSKEEMKMLDKEETGEPFTEVDRKIREELDRKVVRRSRFAMVAITIIGFALAIVVLKIPNFSLKYLWWGLNAVGICFAVPTVLSLYWPRLSSKGVALGVGTALVLAVPVFLYGNAVGSTLMTVLGSVGAVAITTLFCWLLPRKVPFQLNPRGEFSALVDDPS